MCTSCSGRREIPCPACAGAGRSGCLDCQQSGYWTHIIEASYEAVFTFELERQKIPPDILAILDKIGIRNLAIQEHAEFFRLPPYPQEKSLIVPLTALLPVAAVEFSIEGRFYPAVVAGLTGRIIEIEPVLDTIIKPGINALFKISKGPMAIEPLIGMARKYRILRDVFSGLIHTSKKEVYRRLVADYPAVLSEKYARASIKYADLAILKLGRAPRMKGLFLGTALSAAMAALYYFSPLRRVALTALEKGNLGKHILLADIFIWVAGYILTLLMIKILAAHSLRRWSPNPEEKNKKGLPAAGDAGLLGLFTTFAVWIALAATAPADARPEWVGVLLKNIGL